jgi:prevent-host-death family protein
MNAKSFSRLLGSVIRSDVILPGSHLAHSKSRIGGLRFQAGRAMAKLGLAFASLDGVLYGAVQFWRGHSMSKVSRKGAEEARNQLPALLEAAENGRATIITKHGRAVAAIVPVEAYEASGRQQPLVPVEGSGRGLWGDDSTRTLRDLRDEWNR